MIPRTDFHHALLGEIRQCICLFCGFVFTSQMAILFSINIYFDFKTRLLQFSAGLKKYIFAQEGFFLAYKVYSTISMNMTSFLDCKYKHMMTKSSCTVCLPIEYHGFKSRVLRFLVLSQFFRDGMGPFKA